MRKLLPEFAITMQSDTLISDRKFKAEQIPEKKLGDFEIKAKKLLTKPNKYDIIPFVCGSGGIGRRARLRGVYL